MTVRGLYYQAEVHGLAGIDKSDQAYARVQRQVLALRRAGRLRYEWIADATRWMRKPQSYDSAEDALKEAARLYRRSLWRGAGGYIEVWCEKDALAGVIFPVTAGYDVALMVARGFSSETYAYEAVAARDGDRRPYVVLYLGDFDRAGQDAARTLKEKLKRFAAAEGIPVYFRQLAVTPNQIADLGLPTRPHKRKTAADRRWPHPFACELDAMPPDTIRSLVRESIEAFFEKGQLERTRAIEAAEREALAKVRISMPGFGIGEVNDA